MARGSVAKETIELKLKEVFGEDYIGKIDNKIYLWADDGGERVQIAIAMTCPKTFVGETANLRATDEGYDFSEPKSTYTSPKPSTEVTPEEQKNIADLIAALGL